MATTTCLRRQSRKVSRSIIKDSHSPADSGYSSFDSSSERPRARPPRIHNLDEPEFSYSNQRRCARQVPATDIKCRVNARVSAEEVKSGLAYEPTIAHWERPIRQSASKKRAARPQRRNKRHRPQAASVDRFVPLRDHERPVTEKYWTTKHLHNLTLPEKIVRTDLACSDPFIRHRLRGPVDATEPPIRPQVPGQPPSLLA